MEGLYVLLPANLGSVAKQVHIGAIISALIAVCSLLVYPCADYLMERLFGLLSKLCCCGPPG